jgi:hypothetical protein
MDNGTCNPRIRVLFGSGGKFEVRYCNESGKVGKRTGVSDSFKAAVHSPECGDNLRGSTMYSQVSVAQPGSGKMSSTNQTGRLQRTGAILVVVRVSRFSRRFR